MADVDPGLTARPAHVPAGLVMDFDLFDIPGGEDDVQLAMRAFQQNGPDIFWTPRNGGHWVVTRAEDIAIVQRDWERFSNQCYMIPKKAGRIINIASIAGLNGNPPDMKTLAYNTSKTAVIGFTQTLAAEWGKYGINVNAICPGFLDRTSTRLNSSHTDISRMPSSA